MAAPAASHSWRRRKAQWVTAAAALRKACTPGRPGPRLLTGHWSSTCCQPFQRAGHLRSTCMHAWARQATVSLGSAFSTSTPPRPQRVTWRRSCRRLPQAAGCSAPASLPALQCRPKNVSRLGGGTANWAATGSRCRHRWYSDSCSPSPIPEEGAASPPARPGPGPKRHGDTKGRMCGQEHRRRLLAAEASAGGQPEARSQPGKNGVPCLNGGRQGLAVLRAAQTMVDAVPTAGGVTWCRTPQPERSRRALAAAHAKNQAARQGREACPAGPPHGLVLPEGRYISARRRSSESKSSWASCTPWTAGRDLCCVSAALKAASMPADLQRAARLRAQPPHGCVYSGKAVGTLHGASPQPWPLLQGASARRVACLQAA